MKIQINKFFYLSLIIYISLFLKFFIFNLTLWEMYFKAWIIYSLIISFINIFLLIILNKLIIQLYQNEELSRYISNAFILSSFFYLIPTVFRTWYLLPLFRILIILLSYLKYKNFTSKRVNKLNWKQMLFTIDTKINKKEISLFKLIIIIVILFTLEITSNIVALKLYNPHLESMEYYHKETHIKLKTNFKFLPF